MAANAPVPDDEPTIGKLVNDATKDLSALIRKEIQLAKAELSISKNFGLAGAAFFAVAGFVGLLGVIIMSVFFAYLINWKGHGLSLMWSFGIVTLAYFVLAGLAGFLGYRKVKQIKGPEGAIRQGKEIPKAIRGKS